MCGAILQWQVPALPVDTKFALPCSNHLNKKFKELRFDTQSLLPPVSTKSQTCEVSVCHRAVHLLQDTELLYVRPSSLQAQRRGGTC